MIRAVRASQAGNVDEEQTEGVIKLLYVGEYARGQSVRAQNGGRPYNSDPR